RDCKMHATMVNGEPGVVFRSGGAVTQVVALCIEGGVRAVYMTNNPDKLSRWAVAEVEKVPAFEPPATRGRQPRRFVMKIVVIGGSGLIGKKLVPILRGLGQEAVPASPSSGVNTLTGEGLTEALAGAGVVVDVANSPSFADADVLEFFETSTRNLLAAEVAAGVGHHVALSVVGADRLPDSGYMRAKVAQERLIAASGVPYTIVRATQFFEFLGGIAGPRADGDTVRLPSAPMQPLAADDVAAALAEVVVG